MNAKLFALAALLTVAATAQDTGLHLSVGTLVPHGDAQTLTQKRLGGFSLEAAVGFRPEGYGVGFMPYLGIGRMPGAANVDGRTPDNVWGPNSYELRHWRAGVDIRVKPVDSLPVVLAFGPSFHTWEVLRVNAAEKNMGDANSIKLGWRFSLETPVTDRWTVVAGFTQSEWQSNVDPKNWKGYKVDENGNPAVPTYINGLNPSRPAYFSLMGRYRF